MQNFWDSSVWGFFNVMAVLLASLLAANILKRSIPVLKNSLIPHSVLGGGILIIVAGLYKLVTGDIMFDTDFFGGNGTALLELLTYHMLALGFIASAPICCRPFWALPSPCWRCWWCGTSSPPQACCCPLATVRAPVRP